METLIHGDCLEKLKEIPDNSIDSIVTDPPYGLSFMGKKWDYDVPSIEIWKECLRVLKPGGYLLSFAGTRTQHRMAVRIEDAGFEIRDMIAWVYGCLSEDTEILTESGYKPLHKLTQYDRIGVYDITNNIYKWERPQRWSVYKVHQDTAYRIKSDYTDQIVSRNHRCLVEREGKLVFIQADELNEVEYMPTLSDDFYTLQEGHRKLLLKELLRKGKGLAQKLFSKWTGKEMSSERIEVRKEPSLERWSNLLEETRKLQADKICEVSEGVFTDGEKRWICNGTSFDNGSILGDMFRENPSSASYQSRPTGQPTGKPDVISIKQGTQITRRARVTKIEYSGIIFCPTVSTGAFIARRNGQVFITGNSGFPKSLNIGKAVDKLQGNEREVVGKSNRHNSYAQSDIINPQGNGGIPDLTKGTSEWEGWGTALKPALEPITVARKPLSEKTVAENVLTHGTGGINIEKSRVPTQEDVSRRERTLAGEVVCNGFCDKHESYPRSLADICAFSPQQFLDYLQHISSELKAYSSSYSNPLRDEASLPGTLGKALLGVPCDYDLLALRVEQCGRDLKGQQDSLGDYPTLSRLCDVHSRLAEGDGQADVPSLADVLADISRLLNQPENNQPNGSNLHLVFASVLFAYSCSKDLIRQHDYTSCKNKSKGARWPSNLLHDGSEEVLECFPYTKSNINAQPKGSWGGGFTGDSDKKGEYKGYDTGGSAARFFYCAKASKKDRDEGLEGFEEVPYKSNAGPKEGSIAKYGYEEATRIMQEKCKARNTHPTVKPTALMRYLVKLVTPPGGTVLDPFTGSGSTGKACKLEGFNFIGVEREEEYVKIARARIEAVSYIPTLL